VSGAKTAELIKMPFRIGTLVGQRKRISWGSHWLHLLNTIKSSTFGGNAAICQITLTT